MQETCETTYDKLKLEIEDFHSKILEPINSDEDISNLYKGWKVFYSPLIFRPDILFIGINPGNGEDGLDCEHYDKGELEYLTYNYTLANETKTVFEMAGKSELLYNSVKTNYYYIATTEKNDIFKITDFLGRGDKEKLGEQLLLKAREWTMKLIEMIEPKIIICEGKEAFFNLTDLFISGISMTENVEETFIEDLGIKVIGYKRRRSYIIDKDGLSKVLQGL